MKMCELKKEVLDELKKRIGDIEEGKVLTTEEIKKRLFTNAG